MATCRRSAQQDVHTYDDGTVRDRREDTAVPRKAGVCTQVWSNSAAAAGICVGDGVSLLLIRSRACHINKLFCKLTDMMRKRTTLPLRPLMRTRALPVGMPPDIFFVSGQLQLQLLVCWCCRQTSLLGCLAAASGGEGSPLCGVCLSQQLLLCWSRNCYGQLCDARL